MPFINSDSKIFANEEWAICEECGREFIRRSRVKCGKMRPGVRGVGYKTCSKQCAREAKKWRYKQKN